ncbi:MAG TPA: SGNH/GDSL hydrolase family protein [Vicinamibacteria bacterium]|nr:SGNH/GDSL hydrolase family protein [Vicinamibacteria bacterium]
MNRISYAVCTALIVASAACGGGGSPAGPTPSPTPATVPGATVVATLYYDENQNGRADADEGIRIPDVEVNIGGRSARSEKTTGRAVVTGVPAGTQSVTLRADTIPPFYALGQLSTTVQVSLPDGGQVMIPLTLPIGDNQTNVYMAFGDSITRGDGGTAGGYPADLQNRLAAHFGGAFVNNRGADSTNSFEGVERVRRNLNSRPAYTLILYGTNDWNAPECQDNPNCHTVDNLRSIVQNVKLFRSLPFLATIPPSNPTMNPESRNKWVADVNNLVRPMAQQQGAFLVDVEKAFLAQGNLSSLFSDHVHPNDAGYRLISQTFFEAIAHGKATPTSTAVPQLFLLPR